MNSPAPLNLEPLRNLRADFHRVEALRDSAVSHLEKMESKVEVLQTEEQVLARVADLFRALIDQEVIDNAKTAQDLLTEGLRAVFDDLELSVRADVEIRSGKVSVDLVTCQKQADGTVIEGSATDAYGGSVATIQSVLLRIVVVARRGLRPLLLLDESLGAVAEHYVPRIGQFLALLSDRMDMDILAVSHNAVIVEAAKTAYRIQKKNGAATLKEIRAGKK
jgi:DNA repair ATPase RecN